MNIVFGVWAPDEQTFWQSWIDAGIGNFYEDDIVVAWPHGSWRYSAGYPGIQTTTSWDGIVVKSGKAVNGWHTNVKVSGPLVAAFTAGLDQRDANGNLRSIWERTKAAAFFGLEHKDADPKTGFPEGYRNVASGVTYADANDFSSPANVWA